MAEITLPTATLKKSCNIPPIRATIKQQKTNTNVFLRGFTYSPIMFKMFNSEKKDTAKGVYM